MRSFAAVVFVFTPILACAEPIIWHPDEAPPIQLSADEMTLNSGSNLVTFKGNVRIVQGDKHLSCVTAVVRHRVAAQGRTVIERIECEP